MQVQRSATPLFGVQVDLPHLPQRVGLDEVPLVVDVKSMVDGVIFQVGHVAGDVDGSHSATSLGRPDGHQHTAVYTHRCTHLARVPPGAALYGERMDEGHLIGVLDDAVVAVRAALDELEDWGPAGTKPGQYRLDLAADAAALPVLLGAGLAVLSEESGLTNDTSSALLAVIDPIDGSTNAHRGVPFYSTSICVLDTEGPLVGLVVNQVTGTRYAATRGGGAERDGRTMRPSGCQELGSAIVGISGFPGRDAGWAQFRALGAASLECCAVAEGVLDAYLTVGRSTLYGWDYLAGLLVCREAGAAAAERDGRDLIVRDASSRRLSVAATAVLADQLAQDETL